ncbi:MAG: hypothetical protein ABJZ55_00465 [Fuerstiella sp.]
MLRLATTENEARFHHYASVIQDPRFEWLGQIHQPFTDENLSGVDGLIVSDEYYITSRLAIDACKRRGIGTFHIVDGILEWRNLFDNPRSTESLHGTPLFQPLIADLTFAMGSLQKRTMQWLAAENQHIMASGLPRLDWIAAAERKTQTRKSKKLLFATANTPWFNQQQQVTFCREFMTIRSQLETLLEHRFEPWSCQWRVAEVVAQEFDLSTQKETELERVLTTCDALITTPSTLAVEAMLCGIPTMVFDPYASPIFTPSAWHATSASTVFQLLPSLLEPCERRLALQANLLESITPTDGLASERVVNAIESFLQSDNRNDELHRIQTHQQTSQVPSLSSESVSKADLLCAYYNIPSLDVTIAEQGERIRELEQQIAAPSLRQGVGAMVRALTSRPPRQQY